MHKAVCWPSSLCSRQVRSSLRYFCLLNFLDFLSVSYCSVFSLLFSQDGVLDQEEMVAHMELFTAGNKGYQSGQNIKQEL